MIDVDHDTSTIPAPPLLRSSFLQWRADVRGQGMLPVVGVAGSRGKTTIVRLLSAIFAEAGLRTATRTDAAVEIRGRRQRGEIAPWRRAQEELEQGTLDVAVEEIDWLTIQTMGIARESYPIFAISNVCGNRDACLIQGEARRAVASLPIIFEGTATNGCVVMTGDEIVMAREEDAHQRATTFVGLSKESPALRGHRSDGGTTAWSEGGVLRYASGRVSIDIVGADRLRFALNGRAGFQIHNALIAAATAIGIGIPVDVVQRGLARFEPDAKATGGSFTLVRVNGVDVVVDRPNPSWFLRPVLRALRDIEPNRIIVVAGPMPSVPAADIEEVGRLLGRIASVVVLHAHEDHPDVATAFKRGAAMNELPPMFIHTKQEARAVTRALSLAHVGDLVFILSDRQAHIARAIRRRTTGADS